MKELLDKKFFPFLIKPGRYAGMEQGKIIKNSEGKTRYLHAFPEKYEIGQAYMGLQTLYHIVNNDNRFFCERVFAVDTDAEEILRKENIELFSLETFSPGKEFDAIGFTISFELVFTNILNMLNLFGLPLHAKDRDDTHPIIMAGGPTVFNPEPLTDFIDIFFIGDGEEGIIEVLDIIHNNKSKTKKEKLLLIAQNVKSVYIPSLYDSNRKPLTDYAPPEIEARIVPELKNDYYPKQPLVPMIDVAHNFLSVEIMRGCPRGCRFCQAGPMYRPVRPRKIDDIINQVETQLQNSGYHEVSLLSLSSSDYPGIDKLATTLARRLAQQRISIALPSLRPETITSELLDALTKVRKVGLTLAPEAGTERLRLFLRKDFPDEAIYDTIKLAYEKGWTTIKLYFMIGLPTETEKDLFGIVNIVKTIHEIGRKYQGRKTLNITLSPFAPKPHTPFQWDETCNLDNILDKINFIKRNCRINNVNFKHNSIEMSHLQAVFGRGDRDLGAVIESAYLKGCRFDGWTEHFNWNNWVEAFKENSINFDKKLKAIPFSQNLPWSHIRKGITVEHLKNERNRTSVQLKDYMPRISNNQNHENNSMLQYGRSKKKVASRNATAPTKNHVRIIWGKTEKLKYSSHLDILRLFERSIRKAKLPIAYSQGFNPSMKLSFGPPLPLGFTSECEIFDLVFDSIVMPYMIENLKKVLPEGINIIDFKIIMTKSKSLGAALNRIAYKVPYQKFWNYEEIQNKLDNILSQGNILIERVGKNKTTEIDIRQGIYQLNVDNEFITMTLGIGTGGYVKPTEIIDLLDAKENKEYLAYQIHRQAMYQVDDDGNKIESLSI